MSSVSHARFYSSAQAREAQGEWGRTLVLPVLLILRLLGRGLLDVLLGRFVDGGGSSFGRSGVLLSSVLAGHVVSVRKGARQKKVGALFWALMGETRWSKLYGIVGAHRDLVGCILT